MDYSLTVQTMQEIIGRLGLTRKEVSEQIGYSDTYLYNVFRGYKNPTPAFVSEFCRHLKLSRIEVGQLLAAMGMERLTERTHQGRKKAKNPKQPKNIKKPKNTKKDYERLPDRRRLIVDLIKVVYSDEVDKQTIEVIKTLLGK